MFARAVLFAQREGRVIEDYGAPFPHLAVLGVDTDQIGRVDTLDCEPARYSWEHTCRFRPLIAGLRRALRLHDLDLLFRIATASAVINQQFLPKPMFADLLSIARSCGVPGVAVAHTGTVVSFLLDARQPRVESIIDKLQRELELLGLTGASCFHTVPPAASGYAV
jgi:uncharacterized protein involved in propanediol utilization